MGRMSVVFVHRLSEETQRRLERGDLRRVELFFVFGRHLVGVAREQRQAYAGDDQADEDDAGSQEKDEVAFGERIAVVQHVRNREGARQGDGAPHARQRRERRHAQSFAHRTAVFFAKSDFPRTGTPTKSV
ncbi:hypothetical protein OMP40_27015 [Cohnella rhizosphaerae]|uniref:Uncharacterized protein n=1 Tax=Cohnella rhizosphaerae TaxID=1457232 RepID=A0A9X4QWP8_9BACL|nr:hypothetical protein [Cohnella rhizosphaerae]MDG0812577.1 hypothetical protein [Cohnella rhizosphaerae]